jgi:hypothetical protein
MGRWTRATLLHYDYVDYHQTSPDPVSAWRQTLLIESKIPIDEDPPPEYFREHMQQIVSSKP